MNNKEMRVAIYARVSTSDKGQTPELHLNPLSEVTDLVYCSSAPPCGLCGFFVFCFVFFFLY